MSDSQKLFVPSRPLPAARTGQLTAFEPRPQALAQVPARDQVVDQLAQYFAEQRMAGRAKRQQPQPASMPTSDMRRQADKQVDPAKRFLRQSIRDDYLVMNSARLSAALIRVLSARSIAAPLAAGTQSTAATLAREKYATGEWTRRVA